MFMFYDFNSTDMADYLETANPPLFVSQRDPDRSSGPTKIPKTPLPRIETYKTRGDSPDMPKALPRCEAMGLWSYRLTSGGWGLISSELGNSEGRR